MRLRSDGRLRLSPSDLSAHLACPHLTTLSLAHARGEIAPGDMEMVWNGLRRADGIRRLGGDV